MNRHVPSYFALILVVVLGLAVLATNPPTSRPKFSAAHVAAAYGNLPLQFELNRGQAGSNVKFLSHANGHRLLLTSTGLTLALPGRSTLSMNLIGTNPSPEVLGLEELPGKSNYFIGNDPAKWHTNVPTYAKVQYQDVYPGVSLVYYGNRQQLEYDFVVAPGADPKHIQLAIAGAEKVSVDLAGNLVVRAETGELRFHKPVIYQQAAGVRTVVAGGYKIQDRNRVRFDVAGYDATRPLVIDPVLVYSTYLGADFNDVGNGIAVDSAGNAYVVGSRLPDVRGNYGAFVVKLNPAGSAVIYSTYLGGNGGSSGGDIAVDAAGNAFVTGGTSATDFPTTPGAFRVGNPVGFVTRLDATGSALLYSSVGVGGAGIAIDPAGSAYVVGSITSASLPTVNALQPTWGGGYDAYVAKLNPAGSALVYSTYLGGSALDQGRGIAVDSAGNAYITGQTQSSNFPLSNPLQAARPAANALNAFVTKLNATGTALVYSTYLGGSQNDSGNAIAVDSAGNAYVTGSARSADFPITPNAFQTTAAVGGAFVSKFNAAGSALLYSTYLGGIFAEGQGIRVDSVGNAYITGTTGMAAFPTADPVQSACNGQSFSCGDVLVTKLNPTGSALVFSTYLGGGSASGETGYGIAIDTAGAAYVTGLTWTDDFPMVGGAQSARGTQTYGAFVAKISLADAPGAALGPRVLSFTGYVNATSEPQSVRLTAAGSSPLNITSIVASGDFAQTNTCGTGVPGASSCTISVTFKPTALGTRTGAITVTDNAAGSPQAIDLTGTGILTVVGNGGVVNGASFAANQAMAAGSIASIFGTNLSPSTGVASFPLPTSLNESSVVLSTTAGAVKAILFYVSPQQINFQIPPDLLGQSQATLTVTNKGVPSNSVTIRLAAAAPGVFSLSTGRPGAGAILFSSTGVFVQPVGSVAGRQSRPATAGDFISIFCTGLGSLTAPPLVTVSIGGVNVETSYAGPAPTFVGLNQVNVQVPAGVTAGDAVPIILTVGGVTSNTVTIAVQ